ncbi:hypothetical protein ACFPJ4_12040 [Lysinimonas soli]|uniref:Uncharacterized protein n=1 Tax=Lysinimonas soli TaxID=1074233 RepID=A0ABW0NR98_9MICO
MPSEPLDVDEHIEVDGIMMRVRANSNGHGIWNVSDESGSIGTLAESHPYRPAPSPRYIARSSSWPTAETVDGWEDGLRFLLRHRP